MDEMPCEYCNVPPKPATVTFHGVWSGSTAGPFPLCNEHAVEMVTTAINEAQHDLGDGVLMHFTIGVLG